MSKTGKLVGSAIAATTLLIGAAHAQKVEKPQVVTKTDTFNSVVKDANGNVLYRRNLVDKRSLVLGRHKSSSMTKNAFDSSDLCLTPTQNALGSCGQC